MKGFLTLLAGVAASLAIATTASAQMRGHLAHQMLEQPATTLQSEVAVYRFENFAATPVGPTAYGNDQTATGGPAGGLPDRN